MILLTICVWPTSGLSYETFQRDWKRKRSTWDNLLRFISWRQPDENNLYLTETEEYSVIFHSTLWFISAVYKGLADAWSSFHLLSVITHTHYVLLDRGPVTLTLFSLELNRLTTLLMSVLWFLLRWEIMCWTTNIQSVGNIHDEVHKMSTLFLTSPSNSRWVNFNCRTAFVSRLRSMYQWCRRNLYLTKSENANSGNSMPITIMMSIFHGPSVLLKLWTIRTLCNQIRTEQSGGDQLYRMYSLMY